MRVVVDLTRCQGYGQCVFAAPDVFAMPGQESLLYDPDPSDEQREHVLRAQAACPVQAIHVDRLAEHVPGPRPYPYPAPDSAPDRGDGFRRSGRVVIVGASLAGVRAAAVLRRDGFAGSLTLIGDEPHEPYDRPPLSKQVLTGRMPLEHTTLPRLMDLDAEWLLGQRATGLDVAGKRVRLADGREVEFDRLLIATGARARPWPNEAEAALDGVCVLRTIEDATLLRRRLASGNGRVLVIGAGFTGSEVASVCRELGRPVTVVDRGPAPLAGALGKVLGGIAAQIQREHGVDLHCDTTVIGLDGDAEGRLRAARLSDGTTLEVETAVVGLGAVRNVDWLEGAGLAAGVWGVGCDAGCRVFDINGVVTDDIFVAGDVARFPHPAYEFQFLTLEHWGNAVAQAEIAAHNMVSDQTRRWAHLALPVFWSSQFGINIKSVGVPTFADEVVIAQGSVAERRFVAVYGYRGRVTAAVTFDQAMWLEFYQRMIERAAPFPPDFAMVGRPAEMLPVPAEVPPRIAVAQGATVVVTGHDPSERRATLVRPPQ
ncbi:FAD-dependent oxidoreductase [Microtetraspora malaysiensis]|uniref:FAD-dependent oxidoreductase n=1 Tax=Microtetraspora malaysiensis TaxID=161358 RepID=UPI003D8F2EA8